EHDGVLLEVVAHARDVCRDLDAAGQAHAGDLPKGGVRLLRGGGVDAGADPAPLGRTLEGRRLVLRHLVLTALAYQLLNCGHRVVPLLCLSSRPDTLSSSGCCCGAVCLFRSAGRSASGVDLLTIFSRGPGSGHAHGPGSPRAEGRGYSL